MFGLIKAAQPRYAVEKSDAEWRRILPGPAYEVLRQQGTERPFTSPLNNVHQAGTFKCAACDWPLFATRDKFDSGTGWPSFTRPLNARAVVTTTDRSLFMARTEVHCAHCGSHLGHVFPDGPPPTGQRYCMNGVAMRFQPGRA